MQQDRIPYLLKLYLDNRMEAAEKRELMDLLSGEEHSADIQQALEALLEQSPVSEDYREEDWDPLFFKVLEAGKRRNALSSTEGELQTGSKLIRLIRRNSRVAAAILLLLSAGSGWLLWRRTREKEGLAQITTAGQHTTMDIAPGGNKATLTLANGNTIDLDAAKNGELSKQGGSEVVKEKNGQLAYQSASTVNRSQADVQYNLLTTPRGGQYQLVLPDGSKVWLNAASSLRFPSSFSGKERVVELTGEAYFEIARNASMPFKVKVASRFGKDPMQVDVLGTNFNVKAYADEPSINTTLLEGEVNVRAGGQSALLKPGERTLAGEGGSLKVGTADTEEAIAWKNGLFKFDEATIEDVMRQISRWYDVEVVYVNAVSKDLFRGEIYRNVNVSKVLKVLEASGVHFTVEGKKILVQS